MQVVHVSLESRWVRTRGTRGWIEGFQPDNAGFVIPDRMSVRLELPLLGSEGACWASRRGCILVIVVREMSGDDYPACLALWHKSDGLVLREQDGLTSILRFLKRYQGMNWVVMSHETLIGSILLRDIYIT